jgi:putative hydrolase of the HAD superfamily
MNSLSPLKTLFLDIGGVLLTNGWDHNTRTLAAEKFNLDHNEMNERHHLTFDTYEEGKLSLFVSSCFVHYRKPDEDIYRIALDIAQVHPEQVIYIDDRAMFVEVAQGLGITGIIHTGYEATRTALEGLGLPLKD